MIEPFAKHSGLHDGIQLMCFEFGKYAIVSLSAFPRVHICSSQSARPECFGDLNAMALIQS